MEAVEALAYRRTFAIRQEETVRFQQYQGLRRARIGILCCALVCTAAALFLCKILFETLTLLTALLFSLFGLLLGGLLPCFLLSLCIAYSVSQRFQNGLFREQTLDVQINPGGICFFDRRCNTHIYFETMHQIRETPSDFYIFLDKQRVLLLPKHQMEDRERESRQLRHMFHIYAPSHKLRLRKR